EAGEDSLSSSSAQSKLTSSDMFDSTSATSWPTLQRTAPVLCSALWSRFFNLCTDFSARAGEGERTSRLIVRTVPTSKALARNRRPVNMTTPGQRRVPLFTTIGKNGFELEPQ